MATARVTDRRADERARRSMLRSQDDYWVRKLLQGSTIAIAAWTYMWLLESL